MVNEKRNKAKEQFVNEMAIPVTTLWQDILCIPVVGIVDSKRAQQIMEAILNKILAIESKIAIMDISGVLTMDTAVANHIIKINIATTLMGCECIISGMSPAVAQTLVHLGIDVGDIITTTTLKDALVLAFDKLGYEVKVIKETVKKR